MKKNRKQSSAMFPIIAGVAVAFLMVCILCGYVLLSAFFEMQEKLRPVEVTVPDLIGEVVSDEILSAYDASLYSFSIVYEKNDDYKVNTVIAQNPNGGTLRKVQSGGEKCLITLTLSRAEDAMILPDFLMVNYRDAEEQLSAKGIVVTCVKEYNGNFSNGQIFRTEPAAGTLLKEGDAVTLYVSRGAIVNLVSVPDFRGKTPLQAYRNMVDADGNVLLSVGKVTYEYSDEYAEGTIMAQSHTPTVMVYPGETIDFVISKGSAPSTETQEPSDLGPDYLL